MSTMTRLPEAATEAGGHQLFRDLNQRVRELVDRDGDEACFFCECANGSCAAVLWMSAAEYDALCRDSGCYAVLAGHDDRELDTVAGWADGYVIVRCDAPAGVGAPGSVASASMTA